MYEGVSAEAIDRKLRSEAILRAEGVPFFAQLPAIESAAEAHEPHRIAFYLQEVAAQFHLLWTKGRDEAQLRFIISGDPDLTRARLALVRGVAIVVASGLAVFGVTPAEEM